MDDIPRIKLERLIDAVIKNMANIPESEILEEVEIVAQKMREIMSMERWRLDNE
jgi:hypothetical protein